MVKNADVLEIEIDGPHNENLRFDPLQQNIRGRFDAQRLLRFDDGAGRLAREWPEAIPGQRLVLDFDNGNAYLAEPLHDAEYAALREKIEAKGFRIAAARQDFSAVNVPTWAFWIMRAVQSGIAKIIRGKLPEKIDGQPQTEFIVKRGQDPMDKLAAAIERQNELILQLLKAK